MILKMTTSKSVIAKIIADLDLNEDDIRITDIRNWIGEALERIGSVNQLEHKVATIELNDYQAKLPCDLHRLNSVAYSSQSCGGWVPMKKATGSFSVYAGKCENCSDCKMLIKDIDLLPIVKNMYNLVTDAEALAKLNEDENLRQTLSALINQHTYCSKNGQKQNLANDMNYSNTVQYDIKPGYLYSNIRNGFVRLSYHAIYTDEEGMPMVPDNASYLEAIYWYVAMKLMYPKYLSGSMPQHIYYDIKKNWAFYCGQAYAQSLMPNQDEMEDIKNTWHTLVPEIREHDTFLSTLGDEQKIYNQSSGGINVWNF